MNFFVHSVMYSYYAAQAMGFRVPVGVAKSITLLQIAQMVVGIFVNAVTLYTIFGTNNWYFLSRFLTSIS